MYSTQDNGKMLRNKFVTESSSEIIDIFSHLLFAIRMTFPESSCPLLQNNGFSKRQRT